MRTTHFCGSGEGVRYLWSHVPSGREVGYSGGRVSQGGYGIPTTRRDMGPAIPYPKKGHETRDQEGT